MSEKRPEFGVVDDGVRAEGYISRPPVEWRDDELMSGLAQIEARARRHPEYAGVLGELAGRLVDERERRRILYADVASVFLDSGDH